MSRGKAIKTHWTEEKNEARFSNLCWEKGVNVVKYVSDTLCDIHSYFKIYSSKEKKHTSLSISTIQMKTLNRRMDIEWTENRSLEVRLEFDHSTCLKVFQKDHRYARGFYILQFFQHFQSPMNAHLIKYWRVLLLSVANIRRIRLNRRYVVEYANIRYNSHGLCNNWKRIQHFNWFNVIEITCESLLSLFSK